MKKFLLKTFIFGAIFLFLLIIKKHVLPYYTGDATFMTKLEDFDSKSKKFNTVFFGSSRIHRHVNTTLLDSILNDYNISSYNLSVAGTYNPESYYLYENFIDNKTNGEIKLAFVELQALYQYSENNYETTKGSYWNTEKYLDYSLNYIENSNYTEEQKKEMSDSYFKSYLYGYYDFSIFSNITKVALNLTKVSKNGFDPLESKMSKGNSALMKRWNDFRADTSALNDRIKATLTPIAESKENTYHLNFLKNLINKSKAKGIQLIYILPPRLTLEHYKELVPICNKLPSNNIIKLNDYNKYRELYEVKYSFDIGHLNNEGANIFTTYLAEEITSKIHSSETVSN
ncbi:hypothetical protein [Neptunitalea lumnitzerae]|uniref:Uncharacterized protein n=1 Tax=Neptunitalea lumnitzerae TaxID=2965509 RepID=A0ABQ5MLP6_9FLAO|nr:hypothetical protein [Neptunitalea sp. Y10]GLB50333.1 hypothetical protein Y10_27010 [Neptunitalea sp. Y10]